MLTERPFLHFRKAQSVYDLVSLLQSIGDMRLQRLGGDALVAIVRESYGRFENDNASQCYEAVACAAIDAVEDADVAVAILVANELQDGMWSGGSREFAEFSSDGLRAATSQLRSTILRGLDALDVPSYGYESADRFLPQETRLTRSRQEILPALWKVARRMDDCTRRTVASADYGYEVEKHLAALNEVLSREDCRFPKGEHWYPSEVVELVAYVGSTPGFVNCTALLLANALPTRDELGWFDYRWSILSANYNTLPLAVRPPILAGIRYLYEVSDDYAPFPRDVNCDPVVAHDKIIQAVPLNVDV